MIVYSHRGLDFERKELFPENSLDAFQWAAENGHGIELDLQINRDLEIVVAHDSTADRWTRGRAKQAWSAMSSAEIFSLENQYGPLCRLLQVFELADRFPSLHMAIHLKGDNQQAVMVSRLIETLAQFHALHSRTLIFDLKSDVAELFRRGLPTIGLAASVAHDFDISRFQKLTHGTLLSVDALILKKSIYDWAWLDEWDRLGRKNSSKSLYSKDLLEQLRKHGFKTVLVSPELHKAEKHQDSASLGTLEKRWREVVACGPTAICTDYPTRVAQLSRADRK